MVSDIPVNKEYISKYKDLIAALKPIKSGVVNNKSKNITVTYRVVKLGVKHGRRTNN